MAQTIINVGVIANDGTGDGIRLAGTNINTNFTELFDRPSVLSHISFELSHSSAKVFPIYRL